MKIKQDQEWHISPQEAIALQQTLVKQLSLSALEFSVRRVAGVDISYSKQNNQLYAAVVVMDFQTLDIVEEASYICEATFPYIPGLLAFREIPPLLEAFKKICCVPDIVICDGQGIAHPRAMGLASHLGLCLGIPTIGCAKTRLVGEHHPMTGTHGEQQILTYKGNTVGVVLCTKKRCRPLYISPGHLITIEDSLAVIQKCLRGFRLPEPTRQAHLYVNRLRIKNL